MAALTEFFQIAGGRNLMSAQEVFFRNSEGHVAGYVRGTTDNWAYFVSKDDAARSRMEPFYAHRTDDQVNDLIYTQFRGRVDALKNALNSFAEAEAEEMRDLFDKDQYLVLHHVMA